MNLPSALAIFADQLFWGLAPAGWRLVTPTRRDARQGRCPALAGIATSKLLQIMERLLREAALVRTGAPLQQLMQGLGKIPNLQGGQSATTALSSGYSACMRSACRLIQLLAAEPCHP